MRYSQNYCLLQWDYSVLFTNTFFVAFTLLYMLSIHHHLSFEWMNECGFQTNMDSAGLSSPLVPLDRKGCICHCVKWQIHPSLSKVTSCKLIYTVVEQTWRRVHNQSTISIDPSQSRRLSGGATSKTISATLPMRSTIWVDRCEITAASFDKQSAKYDQEGAISRHKTLNQCWFNVGPAS